MLMKRRMEKHHMSLVGLELTVSRLQAESANYSYIHTYIHTYIHVKMQNANHLAAAERSRAPGQTRMPAHEAGTKSQCWQPPGAQARNSQED